MNTTAKNKVLVTGTHTAEAAIHEKSDLVAGAEAFRKDIPNARVEFLDTGHFAIETHVVEIAAAMKEFLAPSGASR
jgi:pimeloyl-ACP methyl ester carboxylesterase